MQFASTLVFHVLAFAACALALPTLSRTETRAVPDVQVFRVVENRSLPIKDLKLTYYKCAPNNDGLPLFGTCCHEFRENGDCKDGDNATQELRRAKWPHPIHLW
ncbi:hypothetical protein ONS95_008289 [Cadophora gregata]|uniref:uncharacterized protein n=1 Tax=Cadophora gregata TaxID=51156 RepID=UPI0026DC70A0|nr:uncharacterized protein ONS95_008289 [Cadophora gregata]KAK0100331.1 hypothetical protein ONS96_007611 [Cadophora gregata f. sp. sojae]KAK0126708.1 hypothetical protein ONS95_008289 [Cadophora gregata]